MTLAILIFVLINLCVVSHAIPDCVQGTYFDGEKCTLCPPGTYREPKSKNDRCVPCRAGTFNPHYGLPAQALCRKCPPNFYSQVNATSCIPCPTGLVSARGSMSCVSCKPGTYPDIRFSSSIPPTCVKCELNTYRDDVNSAVCTNCPDGLASKKGSKSISDCYKCPAGEYFASYYDEPSECQPCFMGTFNPNVGTVGSCPKCSPGYVASFGATKCDPCPRGTKSAPRREKCITCRGGSTTYSEGQSVCRIIGNPCPENTVESPSGDCMKCDAGYYLSDSFECIECPFGSRSLGGSARSCIKCPDRQFAVADQKRCRCPAGEYVSSTGSCSKCQPGTELPATSDQKKCSKCHSFRIANEPGTASCQPCPYDLLPNEKRTKCVKCAPGLIPYDVLFVDPGRTACVNITTGCQPGYRREGNIYLNCVPKVCEVGTPPEEFGKTCTPCAKGYALLKEGKGCMPCPDNSVSDGGVATKCNKCPNGLRRDSRDVSKCSCREGGYGMQNGTCAKCPPGYFGKHKQETCTACEPGTFTITENNWYCWKCPKNFFKANAGPGKCALCPDGFTGNKKEGSDQCVKI